jgi:hypothetical protein
MAKRIAIELDKVLERIDLAGGVPQTLVDTFVYMSLTESGLEEHDFSLNHIWAIVQIASECESAVEFGVRRGISTLSIAFGLKESKYDSNWMKSYDIEQPGPKSLGWDGFADAAWQDTTPYKLRGETP